MIRASFLLHDFLADAAAATPYEVALVCERRRYTYRELDEQANALAHALAARGLRRGDRVIVFADNTAEAAIAFWAVLKADAVVSIVHPQTKVDKLAYLLSDCRARALIADQRLESIYAPAARRSPHLTAVISIGLDEAARVRLADLPGLVAWDHVVRPGERRPPPRRALDIDLAAIIYTSGSTGEPKGVMLTHRNMLAAAASISEYLEITRDDVILCVLPLAFDYGLYQMIMAFAAGARLVLVRSFAYPIEVMRTVEEERVTGFPGVPTIFATLLGLGAQLDLSTVRYVTNTAAALPLKHVPALRARFPNAKIFSMYGLTECKRCTYLPPEDLDRKPGSVGIAIPNTELWIVDEHGQRARPGEIGELVIRGATVMQGYWEKPEATARKLKPGPLPGERVLHTGDLCRLDEDGYLYFVGRMDEVIKSRGEKVPPAEVEATLLAIAGIREAAVIGVPDEVLGFAIKAFVVLEPGAGLDAPTIQRECRARLESFKVPTYVELCTALPRSSNGKIQKAELARAHTQED
ncbi:MAG TPA: AMP-binding protein [Kofleriaceae bacterium]|nr:AMP-binding protein [Kofleriaceae bacterium]